MKPNAIIFTAMAAVCFLLAVQSVGYTDTVCNDNSGRCVFTDTEMLTGNTYENYCVDPSDPAFTLTVIEGELKETEVINEIGDDSGMTHYSYVASGTAEDGNGCLYTITDKSTGLEKSINGTEQEVERQILHFIPKNPKCGQHLYSMNTEYENASATNDGEVTLNKLTCPGGPNNTGDANPSMGAIREVELFSLDLTGENEANPCNEEIVQFLSGTYRESEVDISLPNGQEKEFYNVVVHGIAVDGNGTVYTVRGNGHENFTETTSGDDVGNFHSNVVFQPHGGDGVAFHGTIHFVETASGKVIEWENLTCSDGSTPTL